MIRPGGTPTARHVSMANDPHKVAESYDEIVRRTVLDPDGSVRPTKDQELRAYAGERHRTDDEQALYAQISEALLTVGDLDDRTVLDVEIDRDRVTLRGAVADAGLITKVEDVVRGVDGVGAVDNQLVVTAS